MIAFSDYPNTTSWYYEETPTATFYLSAYDQTTYSNDKIITGEQIKVRKPYYRFLPKRAVQAKLSKRSVQGNGIKGQQRTIMVRG